jgi:hypothetical protein
LLGAAGAILWAGALPAQDAQPTRRIADINWQAAGFAEPAPRVSPRIAAIVRTVRLPVLIPAGFAKYKSFDVVSAGPYDYTASIRASGAKIWINGSRQEVVPPQGAMSAVDHEPDPGAFVEPDPPEPKLINRRFSRYGAGYTITAECLTPTDRHCDEAELARLERTVLLFGGRQ